MPPALASARTSGISHKREGEEESTNLVLVWHLSMNWKNQADCYIGTKATTRASLKQEHGYSEIPKKNRETKRERRGERVEKGREDIHQRRTGWPREERKGFAGPHGPWGDSPGHLYRGPGKGFPGYAGRENPLREASKG